MYVCVRLSLCYPCIYNVYIGTYADTSSQQFATLFTYCVLSFLPYIIIDMYTHELGSKSQLTNIDHATPTQKRWHASSFAYGGKSSSRAEQSRAEQRRVPVEPDSRQTPFTKFASHFALRARAICWPTGGEKKSSDISWKLSRGLETTAEREREEGGGAKKKGEKGDGTRGIDRGEGNRRNRDEKMNNRCFHR